MIRTLLPLVFLFYLPSTFAQISGKVLNLSEEALPYVNVLLLNAADSSFVLGTISGEDGTFLLEDVPNGHYILHLSNIAYQNWHSTPFSISDIQLSKSFGTLRLSEESILLDELEVRAQKMPIQQQAGGMTINVQNSVMTKGSSALAVLERSPGVFINQRDGNISLNGQSGVMIMINGKLQRLSVTQTIAMLEGMSADNIEKIELLTTPPAKYEAEGSAGLINIVFSKPEADGTNGSFSLSAGYGWKPKAGASLNLNHHTTNTNVLGSYAYSYDQTYSDWRAWGTETIPILGGNMAFDVLNTSKRNLSNHNATLGIEHNIKKTLVGTSLTYQRPFRVRPN